MEFVILCILLAIATGTLISILLFWVFQSEHNDTNERELEKLIENIDELVGKKKKAADISKVKEADMHHFYDANDFTHSIIDYMNSDTYKLIIGEPGCEYEKGFSAGLCMAPIILMAKSKGCLRIPKDES